MGREGNTLMTDQPNDLRLRAPKNRETRGKDNAPAFGTRRYVVVSRFPHAMVVFGQPTSLDQAIKDADEQSARFDGSRKVGVFELRLVKP